MSVIELLNLSERYGLVDIDIHWKEEARFLASFVGPPIASPAVDRTTEMMLAFIVVCFSSTCFSLTLMYSLS
jgi:hypothetical protein